MRPDDLSAHPPGSGVLAGAIAGFMATAAMLAFGLAANQSTIAETVADAVTRLTPLEVVEGMISTFGSGAKRLLFGSVLAGEIVVAAALGAVAERGRWGTAQLLAALAIMIGFVTMVALPAVGAGFLGSTSAAGTGSTLVSIAIVAAVFVATYPPIRRLLQPTGIYAAEEAAARRAFLRNGVIALAGLAVGVGGFRWLADRLAPPAVAPAPSIEAARTQAAIAAASGDFVQALATGIPGISPEITPNNQFYVVSKNAFRDPSVDERGWRLEITGLVNRPLTFTYEQIKSLPSATQYFTLQCISNEVGGDLIGNAHWRGVPLGDLLRKAGVKDGAVDVVLRAADDYADSIPIDKALAPGTMLVYEMNGEVLPKAHGYPLRLLVPDIYGMKNVKWITKIEVIDYDLKGFWQVRGWSDVATMFTTSRIDSPRNGSYLAAGRNYVGGIAVAGARGIRGVEVSTDSGRTWAPAVVKPALGPNAWVLWLYEWEMPADQAEPRRVRVRATDGTGALQPVEIRDTLPDGATGYHAVVVRPAQGG